MEQNRNWDGSDFLTSLISEVSMLSVAVLVVILVGVGLGGYFLGKDISEDDLLNELEEPERDKEDEVYYTVLVFL